MRRTITGRTVSVLLKIARVGITCMRVMYFFLLGWGIGFMAIGSWRHAAWLLLAGTIQGGMVEPGITGGYRAVVEDVNRQVAESKAREQKQGGSKWPEHSES